MKKYIVTMIMVVSTYFGQAQTQEAQQLLLNWEKLAQLRQMLDDMKTGYQVLYKGYNTIKDISSGNFNIHKTFLDGLLEVSPGVRQYKRIADIIQYQIRISKESKQALHVFREDKQLTMEEIIYLEKVYHQLMKESLANLEALLTVITAGQMRMNDEERLKSIDRIYEQVTNQYAFLKQFNHSTRMLSIQRQKEADDIGISREIRGY